VDQGIRIAGPTVSVHGHLVVEMAVGHGAWGAYPLPLCDLHALNAAEFYLAIACARGDRAALAQFRTHYFHPVVASLRRRGWDGRSSMTTNLDNPDTFAARDWIHRHSAAMLPTSHIESFHLHGVIRPGELASEDRANRVPEVHPLRSFE
jgi:hypothetical protein